MSLNIFGFFINLFAVMLLMSLIGILNHGQSKNDDTLPLLSTNSFFIRRMTCMKIHLFCLYSTILWYERNYFKQHIGWQYWRAPQAFGSFEFVENPLSKYLPLFLQHHKQSTTMVCIILSLILLVSEINNSSKEFSKTYLANEMF